MKAKLWLIAMAVSATSTEMAQKSDPIAEGLVSVAGLAGETKTITTPPVSEAAQPAPDSVVAQPVPVWKKKFATGSVSLKSLLFFPFPVTRQLMPVTVPALFLPATH